MFRVGVAVQQADGDCVHIVFPRPLFDLAHRRLVQRNQRFAPGAHPLAHRPAQPARHQRRRTVHADVVLLETVFVGHFDRVPETLGHHQRRARALALYQCVGRKRRPVDDQADIAGRGAGALQRRTDAFQHAAFRRVLRGEHFGRDLSRAPLQDDVGKGAAHIHADMPMRSYVIHQLLPPAGP